MAKILEFLQDVFNDQLLMKILKNHAEEFTLNIFTVNEKARDVYLHEILLHTDAANHIMAFLSKYKYLTNIKYNISGSYSKLNFYIYNKNASNYEKFTKKSRTPFNETYLILHKLFFNNRIVYLKDYFGSKDYNPMLQKHRKKMTNFTKKFNLKDPIVTVIKYESF